MKLECLHIRNTYSHNDVALSRKQNCVQIDLCTDLIRAMANTAYRRASKHVPDSPNMHSQIPRLAILSHLTRPYSSE